MSGTVNDSAAPFGDHIGCRPADTAEYAEPFGRVRPEAAEAPPIQSSAARGAMRVIPDSCAAALTRCPDS